MKSQAKKKDKIEKKKERKEIMVVVNLTVPRLKSTTNIRSVRTDRPHQMYPDLYTLSSSFIMIPTWTTSISQTHQKSLEKHSIYNAISTKKRRQQIFNRSTQNGTSASNKRPILCSCWTLFDISGYYFKE